MATYDAQLNTYLTTNQVPSPEPTLLFQPIQLGASDVTVPAITNLSPAEGSTLATSGAVSFDVTDASGLSLVIVLIEYASGECECAFDGTSFAENFAPGSSKTTITNGFTFSIARFGGWRMAPTIRVRAVDTKGNVLS